jgi:hypothetical protein
MMKANVNFTKYQLNLTIGLLKTIRNLMYRPEENRDEYWVDSGSFLLTLNRGQYNSLTTIFFKMNGPHFSCKKPDMFLSDSQRALISKTIARVQDNLVFNSDEREYHEVWEDFLYTLNMSEMMSLSWLIYILERKEKAMIKKKKVIDEALGKEIIEAYLVVPHVSVAKIWTVLGKPNGITYGQCLQYVRKRIPKPIIVKRYSVDERFKNVRVDRKAIEKYWRPTPYNLRGYYV